MRVAVLTALFPVRSEIPFLNQIVGLVERGHVGGHLRRRAPAGRPVPSRRGAAGSRGAHALSDPMAGRPARALARGEPNGALPSRRRAPRACSARSTRPASGTGRGRWISCGARSGSFLAVAYDVAYCAFGMDAPHAVRLRRLGVLSGQLVVAFRGADTTKYVARRGPRVYARTFREARLLLPVCDFLGRRLIALGAPTERVQVHRTGIDLARWPYRERKAGGPGRLRLVTVGRLVEKKGVEFVLRAVRLLVDRGVDVRVPRPRRWAPTRRARSAGRGARTRGSGDARGAGTARIPCARSSKPRTSWSRPA